MSFEERNTFTAILCNLTVTGLFVWQILTRLHSGAFDGPDGLMHWARLVLVMIVISIGVSIVLTILINIAFGIVTGTTMPRHLVDERDQMIRLRGAQVTLILASVVFVGALGGLAYGFGLFLTLNLMLAAFSIGEIGGSLTKFALQRAWI